jgi:hypothetical protein
MKPRAWLAQWRFPGGEWVDEYVYLDQDKARYPRDNDPDRRVIPLVPLEQGAKDAEA